MNIQTLTDPVENISVYIATLMKYFVWAFCRNISSRGKQTVPALPGFISKSATAPRTMTRTDYYPLIDEPITNI